MLGGLWGFQRTNTGLTLLWCPLEQNDVLSQPKKTEVPLGMSSTCSHWASSKGKPFKFCCRSTNHNAGHQMANESLLILSSDSLILSCDFFSCYLCVVFCCSFPYHVLVHSLVFQRKIWNLLIYTGACMYHLCVCVWVHARIPVFWGGR